MWAQAHMSVSREIRPSQHMLGRGLLICGKSAGGCTEVTLQPPRLRSTVLPECIIAAMLPWQCAHRPGSMPSCVPTNCNMSVAPLPHSLHFRETNIGFITKVVGLRSH